MVGIRYYNGVAHPGEYVKLIREPHNAYDRNAIRVDNTRNEKVGHIKKGTAEHLAPLMDHLSSSTSNRTIEMDGIIAVRGATSFSLPLELELSSQSETNFMDDLSRVNNALSKLGTWKPDPALLALNRADTTMTTTDLEVTNQTVKWQEAQLNLEAMFDELVNAQSTQLPPVVIPDAIVTPLLSHQIDGIRWMYQHEINQQQQSSPAAVPFYKQIKERGKTVWLSEITNATQANPPQPIGGSILYVQQVVPLFCSHQLNCY